MPNDNAIRTAIESFQFKELFTQELGWNHLRESHTVAVDDAQYQLHGVAEKRNFKVLLCSPSSDGYIPDRQTRVKIDRQVTTFAPEHLLIFVDTQKQTQRWQWVKREGARPTGIREAVFVAGKRNEYLVQTLQQLEVSIEEEEGTTLFGVSQKVSKAFDVEKVTKKFYDLFKKEHDALLGFLNGIPDENLARWYVSVMLNRLMFIYFIQKKNFLNGDPNYLKSLLEQSMSSGKNQFYRNYLCPLFFDGFAKKDHSREFITTFGKIPYLNGGIFQQHQIEQLHGKVINIPDIAFQQLFEFFDRYQWRLDESPLRLDHEINPDVLGYIFEKYINQKQMGAYYTKEDITGYICRNTIIPRLFDMAHHDCAVAFQGEQSVWRLLRDTPDRYIYDAVKKGTELPLPDHIAAGIHDVTKREGWNTPAPEEFALPTEIWREVVARRQRYQETRSRLASGAVRQIADMITLNLHIERFALDVLETSEGPELVRAFWRAIVGSIPEHADQTFQPGISVLDPTCGSGAFLFASLNILEPMYEACLNRMDALINEDDTNQSGSTKRYSDFRSILRGVDQHPNRRYFIYKSIIINNLFGVDIMEEATEICKLRLFLKLAAQVDNPDRMEPLPDIDFNIRAGNALVGFATREQVRAAITEKGSQRQIVFDTDEETLVRIEEQADGVDRLFLRFRQQQIEHGGEVSQKDKQELTNRMANLAAELNGYLARQYGLTDKTSQKKREVWLQSHQPFHWFVEFYGILSRGGFDAVVGNPPYVAVKKVGYLLPATAKQFPDIYGLIVLRSWQIITPLGWCGMIVPLSITFSEDFDLLRQPLCESGAAWFSSYDNIPAAVFDGVSQRCTIWIGGKSKTSSCTSPMYRWRSAYRDSLMNLVGYTQFNAENVASAGIPKLPQSPAENILDAIHGNAATIEREIFSIKKISTNRIGFSQAARNFISVYLHDPPCVDAVTLKMVDISKIVDISFQYKGIALSALSSLAGEFYFWYWLIRGDGFHITGWIIKDFIKQLRTTPVEHFQLLALLGQMLDEQRFEALVFKKNAGKYVGNYNYRGHFAITRRSDLLIMAGIGLGRTEALSVFDHVQRVLAINEHAGEKSIPERVKSKFKPIAVDTKQQKKTFQAIDTLLQQHYGFTAEELDYIINYDIKYRMGIDGGDGEE